MSVVASFKPGLTRAYTKPMYRYDYGQMLEFQGIELPETFIVHFSNTEELGVATTAIGTGNTVRVPDEYLRHNWDHIFAFVYTGDGTNGQTSAEVVIPVKNRPGLADPIPTPAEESIIQNGINIMNEAVEAVGNATETIRRAEEIIGGFTSGNIIMDAGDADYVCGGEIHG